MRKIIGITKSESGIVFLKSFLFFIILVFADQMTKYLIREDRGFYVCNKNIAWEIQVPEVIFWTVWITITLFIIYLWINSLKSSHSQFIYLPLMLILSGAVSNIIDRLWFGCVIDFIKLPLFPTFNLADIFITAGAFFLLAKWIKL